MSVRTLLIHDAELRVPPNALTGDINRHQRTWSMNSRVARGAIIACATLMALPLSVAQAQPRGGFGGGPGFGGPGFGARGPGFGGPGFGGGWHGGWGGGWGWPLLGSALLGLGLGLFPYYAAPPPALSARILPACVLSAAGILSLCLRLLPARLRLLRLCQSTGALFGPPGIHAAGLLRGARPQQLRNARRPEALRSLKPGCCRCGASAPWTSEEPPKCPPAVRRDPAVTSFPSSCGSRAEDGGNGTDVVSGRDFFDVRSEPVGELG